MNIVADKIKDNKIDDVRQKNLSRALIIIYTIQTNLNFDKDEQTCQLIYLDFMNIVEVKLIEWNISFNYKDIFKSVVSLDKMFNFRYIN